MKTTEHFVLDISATQIPTADKVLTQKSICGTMLIVDIHTVATEGNFNGKLHLFKLPIPQLFIAYEVN